MRQLDLILPYESLICTLRDIKFEAVLKMGAHLTSKTKAFIMAWDLILLLITTLAVFQWRIGYVGLYVLEAPALWVVAGLTLSGMYIFGCYELDGDIKPFSIVLRMLMAVGLSFVGVILLNYLLSKDRSGLFGRGVLVGSLSAFFFISCFYRALILKSYQSLSANADWLFIVNDKIRNHLQSDLKKNSFSGKVTMLSSADSGSLKESFAKAWHTVVVAIPSEEINLELGPLLMKTRFSGQVIQDLSNFYEVVWRKVPIYYLEHDWFVLSDGFGLLNNPVGLRVKRLGDVVLSLLLLILTWPFILVTALMVKIESPGDVIYKQIRTGKNGRLFTIFKFRSMRTDAEQAGAQWAQKNDSRTTRVGRFIRLTRLDELPQLWNVLRGDMSFIGPRPERPEFNQDLEKQIPFYNLRHMVRPGITGWAQVLYPYGASQEDAKEKLQYDLYYIKNYSIVLDVMIVLKTISVVVLGRGR